MRTRLALALVACGFLGLCLAASADDRKDERGREGRKKKGDFKRPAPKPAEKPAEKPADKPADASADTKAAVGKAASFKADVAPLLKDACASCHSGAKRKAGLDVTSYDSIAKFVKAGDPTNSRLHKSLMGKGAKLMPPKNPLDSDQVAVVKAWIAAGAKKD